MLKDVFQEVAAVIMVFNDEHADAGKYLGFVQGRHRPGSLFGAGGTPADVLEVARSSQGRKSFSDATWQFIA
jgi:hypothetical protein